MKLPDEFFDAMANRPRTEFDEWSERFHAALASAPTVDDATNYAALPLEGRESSALYHELSEGELFAMRPNTNIVRVGVGPQPFNASAFPAASRVVTLDASTSNVVFYDNLEILIDGEPIATYAPGSLTTIRWFGWLNSRKRGLRRQRRAKAKAKRAKMRAARYAARWEQAHLRGEK